MKNSYSINNDNKFSPFDGGTRVVLDFNKLNYLSSKIEDDKRVVEFNDADIPGLFTFKSLIKDGFTTLDFRNDKYDEIYNLSLNDILEFSNDEKLKIALDGEHWDEQNNVSYEILDDDANLTKLKIKINEKSYNIYQVEDDEGNYNIVFVDRDAYDVFNTILNKEGIIENDVDYDGITITGIVGSGYDNNTYDDKLIFLNNSDFKDNGNGTRTATIELSDGSKQEIIRTDYDKLDFKKCDPWIFIDDNRYKNGITELEIIFESAV